MTKRKLLPVWIAVSAVIIIAGLVLSILLGFNFSAEIPESKTFEVEYGVVVENTEGARDSLVKSCEDAFKANNLSVSLFQEVEGIDSNSGSKTGMMKLVYTFTDSASDTALANAKAAVEEFVGASLPETAQVYVSVHTGSGLIQVQTESMWRAAVAVVVGAVVVLAYIAVRYGIGSALTGLTLCVHDILLALAIVAIVRIPVFYFAPVVIGGIAAILSLILWLIQCIKLRANSKDPSFAVLSAEEAVSASVKSSKKTVLAVACTVAGILAVLAIALAASGSTLGAILFPIACLVPVATGLYSSLLFGPALHVPVKAAFDKMKAKKKRYAGKAKAEKPQEN